jgi:hypothetical protein
MGAMMGDPSMSKKRVLDFPMLMVRRRVSRADRSREKDSKASSGVAEMRKRSSK